MEKDRHELKDYESITDEDKQAMLFRIQEKKKAAKTLNDFYESRPKRAKKTKKAEDDIYFYSFRENQIAKTCEPGIDLYRNLEKVNVPKRKRGTKAGLDMDKKIKIHTGKSADVDSPFSTNYKEHYNSGSYASIVQGYEMSVSRQQTRSMNRQKKSVFDVGGKFKLQVPRKIRTGTSKRLRYSEAGPSHPRNARQDYTVIIAWLGVYSDEESEEEEVKLVNKRSERRRMLKMLMDRNPRNESSNHQSPFLNKDSHTGKDNISPEEEHGKLLARMDNQDVGDFELWQACKFPSSSLRATDNICQALVVASDVPKLPACTGPLASSDVVEVIDISD